ncbi:CoA transferase [Novosphingobium sp. KCTC 2891]|uniref:CaiB/BaiF CoA transferase family protein n=1 Tax=Novosphingobium sp. KCTC 2891 TaxID=2989730 RepID=UPI002221EC9E|nr:CoA transferase [Novosphingobium sp. KCTC 2891]MCW1383421.1 CoA transferase [Novosphingobium sp. KCTC 2891]
MAGPRLLEGMRVVDLTSIVFGPYATETLADLGAEVIKVESPTGDLFRYAGKPAATMGMGACHMNLNKGKSSVALDLKSPEGKAGLEKLLADADVFIHNVRLKGIERLGFGYEAVKAIKPDIVYVHCVGFGSDGPYRDLQAYDDVIQAATGTATLLPRADGNPRPRFLPSLIADKVAGLHGAYATLAAIIHRLRTGEGQFVEVPMFEAFTHFMMLEHLYGKTFVPQTYPAGYPRQIDPERQPFPTADGWISIVPYTDETTVLLAKVMGADDVLADDRFSTPMARLTNMTAFYAEVGKRTPAKTTAEWCDIFAEAQIPAMPVRDLEDMTADPHLEAVGFFQQREHPTEGGYLHMRAPVTFSVGLPETGPAPTIGQDNAALLGKG